MKISRMVLVVFFVMLLGQAALAQAATGFLSQPLSIYPENPKDGDKVSLTAIISNSEPQNLSGTVLFYDGDTQIATKDVSIDSGSIGVSTVSFNISAGEHIFSASMGSLSKVSTGNILVPLAVSVPKVQMPTLFVTQDTSAFGAQAIGLQAGIAAQPIINAASQIPGKVADQVAAVIPSSVKSDASGAGSNAEDWRLSNVKSLNKFVSLAQRNVDAIQKQSALETKKFGKPSASTTYVDGPLAYAKLFILKTLSYIYSTPYLLYGIIALFVFLVLRSLTLKIIVYIRRKREERRLAKYPKAPMF